MQQTTTYVGPFTAINLKSVADGVSSVESLRNLKDMHRNCNRRHAELEISLYETLSILDPLEKRTTKVLIAMLYDYQGVLSEIARCPERFDAEHLTPDAAREWYSSQVEAIRRLLQKR